MRLIAPTTADHLIEWARRMLGGSPAHIQSAALPWRMSDNGFEVLLITSRETGRWILPKGWPEQGETLAAAAEREAFEEAGIRGRISTNSLGAYHYSKASPSGLVRRCQVRVFALEVDEAEKRWPEKRHRDRRWLTPDDAAKRVMEPALAEMIANFRVNPRKSAA